MLAAPELEDDERFDEEWRGVAAESGYRALLAVPVEAPRTDEGALVLVFFAEERRFADDDLELARNLAGAARGALERSELFEAERRARALAQQLAAHGPLLATELDPAAVLDEVVQQAPALLDADAAAIRVLDGDELVVAAGRGDETQDVLDSRVPSTARLAGDAVQSRAPVARRRTPATTSGCCRPTRCSPRATPPSSAVPLVGPEGAVHGRALRLLPQPRAWREEEIEALAAFAGNAVRRALERRALPARRAREGAQRRDPLQHRRRHRRRRPRGQRRALERGRGGDHRRSRRTTRSAGRRATCCSASSSPARTRRPASGSSRSGAAARRSGSRSPRR